jgi:hypothetical protein
MDSANPNDVICGACWLVSFQLLLSQYVISVVVKSLYSALLHGELHDSVKEWSVGGEHRK